MQQEAFKKEVLRKNMFLLPDQGTGFFTSSAYSSSHELQISRDNGQSFSAPQVLPGTCGSGQIAYNDQVVLLNSGSVCRSTDQGLTWQIVPNAPD